MRVNPLFLHFFHPFLLVFGATFSYILSTDCKCTDSSDTPVSGVRDEFQFAPTFAAGTHLAAPTVQYVDAVVPWLQAGAG